MEVAIVTSSLSCSLPEQVQRYNKVGPICGLLVAPQYMAHTLFGELFY
jgi:hypothetical protein